MNDKYKNIIDLPHHVSEKHPQMSLHDRAAQFAPFAALTGYDASIAETARLTDSKITLSEDVKEAIDRSIAMLSRIISSCPQVCITYFLPDERKSGGAYVTAEGELKKIDELELCLALKDGRKIPIEDIIELTSPCIHNIDML